MYYRYTCTQCGLVVRVEHPASGKDVTACACGADVVEDVEE
jgi:predicted nucleic acid-binding Zn ribbon protein